MLSHEMGVVHPVELVAGEDQHLVDVPLLEQPFVFTNRIGSALKPAGALWCLLRSQHLNKALVKTRGEVEGLGDMAIERCAVELRQHIDLVDAAVDAVANRDINQAVFARQRHGRLGPHFGERVQPRPSTATENDCENPFHQPLAARPLWAQGPN